MKKNKKIIKKNKLLLVLSMWIFWFIPYTYFESYMSEKYKQVIVFVVIMIISTICYYLINNNVLKILIFLVSLVGVTVVLGTDLAMFTYSPFLVIYIYKNLLLESNILENISKVLLVVAPISSIIAIADNFEMFILLFPLSNRALIIGPIIIIIFAFFLNNSGKMLKLKKSKIKLYQYIFGVSILGVMASIVSSVYMVNDSISFFPWFLFITILVFEDNKCLSVSADVIMNRIKHFLDI